jgi:hypothetical protein
MSTPPSFPSDQPSPAPSSYGPIPNYLVWAILITIGSVLFCCVNCISILAIIPGIVAIVFAAQVNSKLSTGDRTGAMAASRNAKLWCWIATGIVGVSIVIFLVMLAVMGTDGYMQYIENARQQMEQRRQ